MLIYLTIFDGDNCGAFLFLCLFRINYLLHVREMKIISLKTHPIM